MANNVSQEEAMRRISVTTEINAPAEVVWAQLTDTATFAEWNPFMPRLTGSLTVGARIEVRITPPGAKGMTFRPTVTAAEENRKLEWLGRFLVPGLFDGRHTFTLTPTATGCTLVQEETFTGVLVGLMSSTLAKTEAGFRQMNEALKTRAERAAA
ncbi:SRPBCC family protein [Actinophytocola glycyrrhizae]|uniref:SRPBCC family protein n=1 Tax=Actinophytocola glycyrrhizae TaxID=2044873 RepID=A0ABV9RW49_9PSEU